ncbi:MG2 domain-containing protein [Promethearchaeum syntrophicum]|uniref:MG2 domain-containing protein n=1 Tax=Promethearchaeum syntrophicum TaxID=2594042 RepID=A0A5B9DD86_9ARCH|nr:MG2 domain-containing protein [Candidatus Prometheoarchaeum syntrophicum]QEE16955.1 MG2 domain protein [Candidatus Prometheoarchaeum syntrophicum]
MKILKKKKFAGFLLLILAFQLTSLSITGLGVSNSTPSEETPESFINSKTTEESHSSPFHFPLDRSSPLMVDENEKKEDLDEITPKSSYQENFNNFALTLNLYKSAVSIGEQIEINLFLLENLTAANNERIVIEIYNDYFRSDYYWYTNYYEVSNPIYQKEVYTNSLGQASITYTASSEGLYTIFAYVDEQQTYKEFTVGNTGIFCKGPNYYSTNQEYRAAVQLVDLTDFSPMPFANFSFTFSYYDFGNTTWVDFSTNLIQTDNNGYGIIDSVIPQEEEFLSSYYSSLKLTIQMIEAETKFTTFIYKSWDYYYYSLWNGQQKTNQNPIQYIVSTDKTIYNPGETIHLRSLVLEYSYMEESRIALRNTPVNLTILNPSELAFFWTTILTDNNGVLKFDIPLDNDCELGIYGVEFNLAGNIFRYNIKVEHYTKPVFRVNINTNGKDYYPEKRKFFPSKIIFTGSVDVAYYFGQPVVDASVDLIIKDYSGENKFNISGRTNGEGQFYFLINLNSIDDLDYSFSVQAEVTDIYGREAGTERYFSRFEEIYSYGYLSDWAPKPNESLEYYFYAYQFLASPDNDGWWNYEYNPLMNVSTQIEIYGVREYPIIITEITTKELLQTHFASTNIYGGGELEFNLPFSDMESYHFFEIRIIITLNDGRETESSTYFRYRKYSLDIDIQTESLNQGENFTFSASYTDTLTGEDQTGEGRIYIYQSDHQLIGQATLELTGTEDFEVPISHFSPNGTYYIYSYVYSRSNFFYGGFYYNSEHKTFEVGTSNSISITSNKSTSENKYSIDVAIGEIVEISGITDVSTNLPVYLEIYKRGLSFSVPLIVNGEGEFLYSLPIIGEYGPDFTVMVYTISQSGKLYEDVLIFKVLYDSGFTLTADKEVYEPGDDMTLTITPENNSTTLLSISFIDSSVLDVEPEDDSELAYFKIHSYGAYISSASSWGNGFDKDSYWWIDYDYNTGGIWYYYNYRLAEGELVYEMTDGSENFAGGEKSRDPPTFDDLLLSFDTDIRKNISESANWIPSMIISEPVNLTFHLPENIGEWTIRVVGNGLGEDGSVFWGNIETLQIKTFLPFFIEFDIPQPVIQDDILTIKGYVYNYIGQDIYATIAINSTGFTVLNRDVQELMIPNGFVSEVEFSVYCDEPFLQEITLLAATNISGTLYSDAKQLSIYIEPNGIEIRNRTVGFLNASDGSTILNYTLDPMAIYHKETLAIYTDLMDVSIESWSSLIGYPYGCIEQTISKLLPTALIYKYLLYTDQLSEGLENEINNMILSGINRVYGFQHSDGGWGWWEDDQSTVLMTSIVLYALNQINELGFKINSYVLNNGISHLLNQQDASGSWEFQYYSANEFESTSLILKSLLASSEITGEMDDSINLALSRLETLWESPNNRSSYGAALLYIATAGTYYENMTFNSNLIDFLKNSYIVAQNTIYWDKPQEEYWYWRNLGNNVEITSYAAWALSIDDFSLNYPLIKKAVQFIIEKRNNWGWMTTADTSAAINSLTAIKNITTSIELVDFEGNATINVNNAEIPQYELNFTESSHQPNEIQFSLSNLIDYGTNSINITLNGTGQISYILNSIQILRSNPLVEIPETIEAKPNENFYLDVNFTGIDPRMPLMDTKVSIIGIPENITNPSSVYTINAPILIDGDRLLFGLKAPNHEGIFSIDGISVSGFIEFLNPFDNSTSRQLFHKTLGPVNVIISENSVSSSLNINEGYYVSFLTKTIRSSENEDIFLSKLISKYSNLIPGDILTVSINITNDGELMQFYALDDEIPAGTAFLEDSIEVSGFTDDSEISHDILSSGKHFFFPTIPNGNFELKYQIQVESIKNSNPGNCKLWGMYDDFEISTNTQILENIPRKFYANDSMYLDHVLPEISEIKSIQNHDYDEIQINLDIAAFDNNPIQKIRVVFSQNGGWRAKTTYSRENDENFSITLSNFENVDSEVDYFIEIIDIYGNIISSNMLSIKVYSTLAPYLTIALLIGISIGLASVVSKKYGNKLEEQQEIKEKMTEDDLKNQSKITFLEDSDKIVEDQLEQNK